MRSTKAFLLATLAVFLVTFNLGYVFHDLLLGDWFHAREPFAREHFILPYIAAAFAAYSLIVAHLYPLYRKAYEQQPRWVVGLHFGWLMGVLFDALQGGIIEVATFEMPISVFFVDSGYHVFVEGSIAGLLLSAIYGRVDGT